jgi:hypothetical protein
VNGKAAKASRCSEKTGTRDAFEAARISNFCQRPRNALRGALT